MRIFKMKSISIKETIKEYAGIIIALKKIRERRLRPGSFTDFSNYIMESGLL